MQAEASARNAVSEHLQSISVTDAATSTHRRLSTIVWGAIPLAILTALLTTDHIPGTNISLAVPYAAQGPGPMFNTLGEVDGTPVVEIAGAPTDETEGNLNMTTVSVRTNMTLTQALNRWISTDDTLVPIEHILPPNTDQEKMQQYNEQAFVASEAAATVAAMKYLGKPTKIIVHDAVDGSAAAGKLTPGDVLQTIDGTEVTEPSEVQRIVREHAPGDTLRIGVARDGQTREITLPLGKHPEDASQAFLGILMTSEAAEDIAVTYNLNDVGGPSAGMIFSLAVIDKLSPGLLNGGKYVAGTGTINERGEVGPIGGIQHKIHGARDAGAQLFLAPTENCAEVRATDAGEMVVAAVHNLDEAVAAMQAFADGNTEAIGRCG